MNATDDGSEPLGECPEVPSCVSLGHPGVVFDGWLNIRHCRCGTKIYDEDTVKGTVR